MPLPLVESEWKRSIERKRMLDAARKRMRRMDPNYRQRERIRNAEARRKQRANPEFREAERARAQILRKQSYVVGYCC